MDSKPSLVDQQHSFILLNSSSLFLTSLFHLRETDFLKLQLNEGPEFVYLNKDSWLLFIYDDVYSYEQLAQDYSEDFAQLYFLAVREVLDYLFFSPEGLIIPGLPTFDWG